MIRPAQAGTRGSKGSRLNLPRKQFPLSISEDLFRRIIPIEVPEDLHNVVERFNAPRFPPKSYDRLKFSLSHRPIYRLRNLPDMQCSIDRTRFNSSCTQPV